MMVAQSLDLVELLLEIYWAFILEIEVEGSGVFFSPRFRMSWVLGGAQLCLEPWEAAGTLEKTG